MSGPARALFVVALATACARSPEPGPPAAPAPTPAADPCIVAGTPGRSTDTLDVLLDPPPERLELPQSGSDWFVAAHAVETLVRLDCTRAARPGLAVSWDRHDGGQVWMFSLRDAARPDGSPLTADLIMLDWQRPRAAARLALAEVVSVAALDERRLRISFAQPTDSAPALLADPVLAPGIERPDLWQMHAGPYLRLIPPTRDLRDALDAGADIMVTADPATLAYARGRSELITLPLPWGRTYVLVSSRPFPLAREARFRASLARDVVRQEARPAELLAWWDVGCSPAPASAAAGTNEEPRLAFPVGDAAAAALAARLIAVGAAGPRGVVLPLPPAELLTRLNLGRLAMAVLPLSRLDPMPCAARSLAMAGWSVAPLVDTRAHLIARRDGPALEADGFGAIRLAPVEAARP
jgi:hypothetical protein